MARKMKNVTEMGEINLHSPDAVNKINELVGTPVDIKTLPQKEIHRSLPSIPEVDPPPKGTPRILLVVPLLEVSFDFFQSFLKFWQSMVMRQVAKQVRYEIGYHFIYRKPVHIAETMGAVIALRNKCTHLLLMDDDIYDITPEMVDKLLEADKDVISGVMYASGFPYAMCTFRRFDLNSTLSSQPAQKGIYRLYEIPCRCPYCFKEKKIVELTWNSTFCVHCRKDLPSDFPIQPVDLIPFCFTLIKTSVFQRIKKPWFHCNTIFPTDSWFADRCLEAGIQEYAHMQVRLNHRGINDITRPHRFNEGLALAQHKGAVIELTPEQMELHIKMVEAKMNAAEERTKAKVQPVFAKIK